MAMKLNITAFSVVLLLAFLAGARCADFDVTKYGAKADGKTDAGPGMLSAWKEACAATTPSKVVIPRGDYVLNPVTFAGPCKAPITVQVQGTLKAQPDLSRFKSDGWIRFSQVEGFTLIGGTYDGQGSLSWSKNQCSKTFSCTNLPTNIRFDFLTNAHVQDITSLNSKMFHINILGCKNITLSNTNINAPETSPNTDGIHVGRSDGVNIDGATIKTGDDCVSLGDGSKRVTIMGVHCGPGHGISVGSLGKFQNEEEVVGINVKNCTLSNTMFGVRVKTWPASPVGSASDMHFEDITMDHVSSPILIDQGYCPWNQCKTQSPSKVKISNVSFKNIKGTSATQVAMKLACSSGVPCDNVQVSNVDLAYNGKEGPAQSVCSNVNPTLSGTLNPKPCTAAPAA